MVILDTNVLSAIMHAEVGIVEWLDDQARSSVWTTTITVFEIRFGLTIMPGGRRRTARETAFARLVEEKLERRIVPFDHAAAEEAALLMASRQLAGRPCDLRDTMIAGIALAQRATLATRNVRHFEDLSIPVVNPWKA